jgi:hypothetical protein
VKRRLEHQSERSRTTSGRFVGCSPTVMHRESTR